MPLSHHQHQRCQQRLFHQEHFHQWHHHQDHYRCHYRQDTHATIFLTLSQSPRLPGAGNIVACIAGEWGWGLFLDAFMHLSIFSTYPANCIFITVFFQAIFFRAVFFKTVFFQTVFFQTVFFQTVYFLQTYFLRFTSLFKHIQGKLCQGKHLCREIWTTFSSLALQWPKLSRSSYQAGSSGGLCR